MTPLIAYPSHPEGVCRLATLPSITFTPTGSVSHGVSLLS